jgi:Bacterial regulatory proteins, luxR family
LRWRAAGPTRSHGTPSAGLGLASLRGLPGTGKELGAATGAQARTAGLRGCAFPLFGKPSSLGLTQREAEVLALVADGQTNRQIGQALFITPKTASIHISRILAKLGSCRSRGGSRDRSSPRPRQAMSRVGPCRSFSAWQRMRLTRVRPARCHHLGSADPGSRDSGCSLGRVDVSTRSNALYDRCATEWGVPEVSPMAANVLVRGP